MTLIIDHKEFFEIPDTEKLYVSRDGKIYSGRSNQILKPKHDGKGYAFVKRYSGRKNYNNIKVHRAVALVFIPNPNNLPQVNHIDGNKENNTVSNLEWISNIDNMHHAFTHGLMHPAKGEQQAMHKLTVEKVLEIRSIYPAKSMGCLAKEYGVSTQLIFRVIHRLNWKFI
ncbi:HNH endonuclease family protein [Loigolactobacillus zhaoyuanensis]|uniref:HNH endonuclease n=1 Tax=Loigolactobacillus zhaoyuanensis TaxID=2486017 RepID=A0ABW8U9S4_9LACO